MQVRSLGETSKSFEVRTWLRQKDALFPVLFKLALEQVVKDMKDNRSIKLFGNGTTLAYADNIVILEKSQDQI